MLAHTGFGAIGSKVVSIALTPSDDAEKVKAEPIQTEVKILAPQQTVSAISPTPVVSTPLPATEEFDGEVHAIELIAPDLVASLEGKNVKKIVEAILDNLIKVNKHIDELKEENSILQKKVEDLVQSDERRKFLGTDSAKEPFGIFVKCGKSPLYLFWFDDPSPRQTAGAVPSYRPIGMARHCTLLTFVQVMRSSLTASKFTQSSRWAILCVVFVLGSVSPQRLRRNHASLSMGSRSVMLSTWVRLV